MKILTIGLTPDTYEKFLAIHKYENITANDNMLISKSRIIEKMLIECIAKHTLFKGKKQNKK